MDKEKEIDKFYLENEACCTLLCTGDDGKKYVEYEDWQRDVNKLQNIIKKLKQENKQAAKEFADSLLAEFEEQRHFYEIANISNKDVSLAAINYCIKQTKKRLKELYCDEQAKINEANIKPKVVTLCGSTKFKTEFEAKNRELTLAGNIVISVACFGHSGDTFTDEQKVLLDEIHKRKIDLADAIYVINKDGYIGASTRSEIEYAKAHGKEIIFMEAQNA